MTDTPSTPNKWSLAMRDGLLLSLITLACTTLSGLSQIMILNVLLWIVKLVGSIWLLSFFMKRYGAAHPEETRTTGYGIMVCLFSSIICAVFTYLSYRFLFPVSPETLEEVMAQIPGTLTSTPGMTQEAEDMVYWVFDHLPQMACVGLLIYNTVFGIIVSAIIGASSAKCKDPFGNDAPQAEEKDELA